MCKEMMSQRNEIEAILKKDLERCIENIRKNGGSEAPSVLVDLEGLYIANKEYFEHQGFFFDSETKIENKHVRYYARMKPNGEGGELSRHCWYRIREARESFMKKQRQQIWDMLRDAGGWIVSVDMSWLLFENKLFFEESGYYFEPDTRPEEDGTIKCLARMRKHNKRES